MRTITSLIIVGTKLVPTYSLVSQGRNSTKITTLGIQDPNDLLALDLTTPVNAVIAGGGGGSVSVVASASKLNQTGNVGTTTLYTTPSDATIHIYRLSGYIWTPGGGGASTVASSAVDYNLNSNSISDVSFKLTNLSVFATVQEVQTIAIDPGVNITYAMSLLNSTGTYNVYFALEKLF